jgi:hypothetical protein
VDFAGVVIRYKTTGYPANAGDGTLLVDLAGTPGSVAQTEHTGTRCGTICYYAAFAHDAVPNYASAATASAKIQCADFDLDSDVDQDDFGVFQRCLSGDGMGFSEDCAPADLSGDGDVDIEDFGLFWPCMAGADNPPGC